jgi:hypothetical protein
VKDRRKVLLHLTDAGRKIIRQAPSLLQDRLSDALANLPELEQVTIAMSLERVVALMEAEHIDTSPNLVSNGEIQSPETVPTPDAGPPDNDFPFGVTA